MTTLIQVSGEVVMWPDSLLQGSGPKHWLVCHCKPRQEKRFIADLKYFNKPGISFFERRLRRYRGKGQQEHSVPLLGGYVFVGDDDPWPLYDGGRVVRCLTATDPSLLTVELRSLVALIAGGERTVQVRPHLQSGDRIVINHGCFAGFEGIITRRAGNAELVVNIQMLGTSVSTQIPAEIADQFDA